MTTNIKNNINNTAFFHKNDVVLKYFKIGVSESNIDSLNYLTHYNFITKKYKLMKKYLHIGILIGDSKTFRRLGFYYYAIEKNVELMLYYYQMSIELGNVSAMNDLGFYYFEIKYYHLMKKYYQMAIEFDDPDAKNMLDKYYETIEQNYTLENK